MATRYLSSLPTVLKRPHPSAELLDPVATEPRFAPAPDLEQWLRATFIQPLSVLYNPEHTHLQSASLGVLWTNVANERHGNVVAATCEIPIPSQGNTWQKARLVYQLQEWFGAVPDFLLMFHAGLCDEASDTAFCATAEHELYHAAQARDQYGTPRFRKDDGSPIWTIKGHDVEEFVGIASRYGGSGVLNPKLQEMAKALRNAPTVESHEVRLVCGTCLR